MIAEPVAPAPGAQTIFFLQDCRAHSPTAIMIYMTWSQQSLGPSPVWNPLLPSLFSFIGTDHFKNYAACVMDYKGPSAWSQLCSRSGTQQPERLDLGRWEQREWIYWLTEIAQGT